VHEIVILPSISIVVLISLLGIEDPSRKWKCKYYGAM